MFTVKPAAPADLDALIAIESACFPPAEAADAAALRARFSAFPENFLKAEDTSGATVGFINGCTTTAPSLPDALYHDTSLHTPDGAYMTVFGLDVLPACRRRGAAAALLNAYIALAAQRGKAGVVLTCKEHLIPYYERFGFCCQGRSASTHGGAVWNDMVLRFADKK